MSTDDEAVKKMRDAAREGRIEFAPQDGVDAFDGMSAGFLDVILGHSEAWISDMSDLSDFYARNEETYARIESVYGVDVRGMNNILEILRVIINKPSSTVN